MAQKHLHELLKEDQEPFLLTTFLADRRSLLKRPSPRNLHLNKRKPIFRDSSDFPGKFSKTACFFSFFHDSPDLRKSPLIEFQSPAKSPCRNSNAIFLHIPARTAGLLLEAALRIQKQSVSSRSKSQSRSNGFGIFGSFLKRLTRRSRKREIGDGGVSDSAVGRRTDAGESSRSPVKMVVGENEYDSTQRNMGFEFQESNFCDSPFHFVLQSSDSPGDRTPEFSSPAASPARGDDEDIKNSDAESLKKLQVEDEEEEEEEKEQSSPVSVLDPPFEDDDEGHYEDGKEDEDDYDLECSYAIVQKAKQQLLKKLRRFERLAELDPRELEKILLEDGEEDDNGYNDEEAEEEECEDHYNNDKERRAKDVGEIDDGSLSFESLPEAAKNLKRLVSDEVVIDNRKEMLKRVCSRLGSWEGTDAIDEMVERDFRRELTEWNGNEEQMEEMAIEIELEMFRSLVEEMQKEVDCLTH